MFATGASITLGLGVYDTQCGAKLFRASDMTRQLFQMPFVTNWIFDVELIARMICWQGGANAVAARIYEEPLDAWRDVEGSKVRPRDFFKAFFELTSIYRTYLSRRAAPSAPPVATFPTSDDAIVSPQMEEDRTVTAGA